MNKMKRKDKVTNTDFGELDGIIEEVLLNCLEQGFLEEDNLINAYFEIIVNY